jgi:hypothetical protein
MSHCTVDACERKHKARGYCSLHYHRWQRHGDAEIAKSTMGEHREKNPLYMTYKKMKARCGDPNNKHYGGRGIRVCDRWLEPNGQGFRNFVADMGERPEGLTLDRKDDDGNYEASNCRWTDWHTQQANRRDNNEVVGVHWNKRDSCWMAELVVNRKRVLCKSFKIKADAVEARKQAESLVF